MPQTEILNIIDKYKAESSTLSIDAILGLKDRLAVLLYYHNETMAELKRSYTFGELSTDIEEQNKKDEYLKTMGYNTALTKAKLSVKYLKQESTESKMLWYKLDVLKKGITEILAAMSQRVSYLKEEKNREFLNNSHT